MQHKVPLHPTAMVKWRQRVGSEKLAELMRETIDVARRGKHVTDHELSHVNVDTTVQEKNITHPTDSKLLLRCALPMWHCLRRGVLDSVVRRLQKAGFSHPRRIRLAA